MPPSGIFFCTRSEYFATCNRVFNFNFLAPVVSEMGGPKFTLRGPSPPDASSGKISTHPQVLAYNIYNRKVSASCSINVWITESSLYNRFRIERSPKMGVWGDFGGRGKNIWWESTFILRIARLQTSLVQIWCPCSSIIYGYSHL